MRKNYIEKQNKKDMKEYRQLIEKTTWHDDKMVLKVKERTSLLPCDYILLRKNGIHLIGFSPVNCDYILDNPVYNKQFTCDIYGVGERTYTGYNPHYEIFDCFGKLNEFLEQQSAFETNVGLNQRYRAVAVRPTYSGKYFWTHRERPVIDRKISRLPEVLRHEGTVIFLTDAEIANVAKCLLSLPYVKRVR